MTSGHAAANHNFYLSEFYGGNRLAKKEMTLAGTRLDIAVAGDDSLTIWAGSGAHFGSSTDAKFIE